MKVNVVCRKIFLLFGRIPDSLFFKKYAKMYRKTFDDCPRHHVFVYVVRTSNFSSGTHTIFTNKMVVISFGTFGGCLTGGGGGGG